MTQTKKSKFKQNIIAIVYDFDGTLSPQPMQEYTVLPELGVSPKKFWEECTRTARQTQADDMLTYMRLLIEKIEDNRQHLSRATLRELAAKIKYFPGVHDWFERINQYVKEKSGARVEIRHYIVSAGLREILEGIEIKRQFEKIYASEYFFDHHGRATFPTVVVNDTAKTQFLFRINKGIEDINESINEYMPESERAIPFSNMIYIGDGLTDVPCMTVTKNNGGYAIAVHKPRKTDSIETCKKLFEGNRIDYYAGADYRPDKPLDKRVKLILDVIIARIFFNKERHGFSAK